MTQIDVINSCIIIDKLRHIPVINSFAATEDYFYGKWQMPWAPFY